MTTTFPTLPAEVLARAAQPICAEDAIADAVRRKLAAHLEHFIAHQEATWEGTDPEAAHQMRVAIRRARSVLRGASPLFRPKLMESFDHRLRWLARRIAQVRERDLLLADFQRFNETLEEEHRPAFEQMMENIRLVRDHEHDRLQRILKGRKYHRLVKDLIQFVLAPTTEDLRTQKAPSPRIRHFAGGTLLAHYGAIQAYDGLIHEATADQLHELRIACKRLRYIIELFEAPLAPIAHHLTKPVKAMQRQLGLIHDLDMATECVQHLSQEPTPASQQYIEQCSAARAKALEGLPHPWNQLTGPSYHKALSQAVISLL